MKSNIRIIEFDQIHNFRDIGGMVSTDGRMMKRGICFRSDSLHSFSKSEIRKIETFNIRSIIDLRTPKERAKKAYTSFNNPSVRIENIPLYPLPEKKDPGFIEQITELLKGKYKGFNFETFMFENYHRMATEHSREINHIITFLSEKSNLPSIIHCNAGKGRTGWISFLLQSIARVPVDLIYNDYLLSNNFMFNNKNMKKQEKIMKLLTLGRLNPNTFRPMQEARIEYLRGASNDVLSRYETIDKYLIEFCNIPLEVIKKIKNIFLDTAT